MSAIAELASIEAHLREMKDSLIFAIVDPFYYAHYGEQIAQALKALDSLKAQHAPEPSVPASQHKTRKKG